MLACLVVYNEGTLSDGDWSYFAYLIGQLKGPVENQASKDAKIEEA